MSRTVLIPCGSAVAFVSGVWRLNRIVYSMVAFFGACIWSTSYATLGYLFAGQVPEMSALVTSALLVGICAVFTLGFALWLVFAWNRFPNTLVHS